MARTRKTEANAQTSKSEGEVVGIEVYHYGYGQVIARGKTLKEAQDNARKWFRTNVNLLNWKAIPEAIENEIKKPHWTIYREIK